MGKTTNKFAPEVGTRVVRMVADHEGDHTSRWVVIASIAEKISAGTSLHQAHGVDVCLGGPLRLCHPVK